MWQLAEDTISDAEIDELADWLRGHPRLTQGELVHEFEREWSQWQGSVDSVFVTSGTTANFALMAVVGRRLGRPPRVGVSAVTWATNVTPALLLGYPVVVFDVSPQTLGVDSDTVCDAMESGAIDVLFVTHLLGFNALTDDVIESAARTGTILLEDCCEAHGATHGASKVGTVGLGGTFSFYFGHHMSTIEGGMVSPDDPELADELRLMRAHGLARESARYEDFRLAHPDVDPRFLFVGLGLNFRTTEINAFLGLKQLSGLDSRIQLRNTNLRHFLNGLSEEYWRDYRLEGASSFALPIVARDATGQRRASLSAEALGVESRPVVAGNLLRQPFLERADVTVYGPGTPVADEIHEKGMYVGNGHHVSPQMITDLTDKLNTGGAA